MPDLGLLRALAVIVQAEVSAAKQAMQQRVEEAVAESQNKSTGLRDAREKNVHFSARVIALNSRIGALQRQVTHVVQSCSLPHLGPGSEQGVCNGPV